ncbi:ABC transporter permease [Georgenia sp. TF02-10]|uniref:ABC transporter permease n=1 Tax=Georgenia sp. TF02-10 TaxID=2917725 RepID=UPI001FA6C094|nr:ABC transporter permease [Georgenia sp. TF02-10]UNX55013.1 ABC transporter permease [Georgenia sp. TF02-10]
MTTTAPAAPGTAHVPPAPAPPAGIPWHRLLAVELRKQVDTRAGRGVLLAMVLLGTALLATVLLAGAPAELTWTDLTSTAVLPLMLLLPVIGILAATSEWSQRTALTTFALEPRRTRVNLAKLGAALLLGLLVLGLTLVVGAAANAAGALWLGGTGSWALDTAALLGLSLTTLILVAQGVGFGLLLLSTPVAIVAYLLIPTLWSVLPLLVPALDPAADWLDLGRATGPLLEGTVGGVDWARLGTAVLVWVGLPVAGGLWRTARRDVA